MTDNLQKTARTRELNDDLRKHLIGGGAVMTGGIVVARQLGIDLKAYVFSQ